MSCSTPSSTEGSDSSCSSSAVYCTDSCIIIIGLYCRKVSSTWWTSCCVIRQIGGFASLPIILSQQTAHVRDPRQRSISYVKWLKLCYMYTIVCQPPRPTTASLLLLGRGTQYVRRPAPVVTVREGAMINNLREQFEFFDIYLVHTEINIRHRAQSKETQALNVVRVVVYQGSYEHGC